MRLSIRPLAVLLAATSLAAVLPGVSMAESVTGAGSSFAAPIYQAWSDAAKKSAGVSINYQSVGSSAGQNQVLAGTVDFGASDAPMDNQKIESAHLFQFPTVMGGIVPVVNIPGMKANALSLSGEVLAGIYAGEITEWNDAKIAALNPGVKLPDLAIAPIHRADGSGTTFVFTSYLARSSDAWKNNLGAGTSISWPGGLGARGNDGVAATVQNTEGAIGYVEYAYASRNHLTTTKLHNHAGENVEANQTSFAHAAESADWEHATHFAVDLLDTAGHGAWPIVSATYVLTPVPPKDAARGKAVRSFFTWAFKQGDETASKLDYVALPQAVKTNILSSWK
ncbi:phosphate-binding protein PstS [Acetobacter cibinongensis]|uniref:Phosphate-binding protein PstS n=1 Tax=Acetobacter cibinongensis TaxID=146475 RepID=A0A0D6N5Y7_9PROT|nr:phosphate ABC transporter substrate-binding protein PstS [Acetobacter cibinongensis]GAN61120.1 ABC transporter phosphate permease [Acetobacter cibinongensis]GBQ12651.1 phosphate-binding periplasmic protein [Acetobacter cibinongensis NRIC 0482]GEL58384.1 phosphate-binding protein PstS [Acetobacter cibinongensis]